MPRQFPMECPGCKVSLGGPITAAKHYEERPRCDKARSLRNAERRMAREKGRRERRNELRAERRRQQKQNGELVTTIPTKPGVARLADSARLPFCPGCGRRRGRSWQFCGFCGAPIPLTTSR